MAEKNMFLMFSNAVNDLLFEKFNECWFGLSQYLKFALVQMVKIKNF